MPAAPGPADRQAAFLRRLREAIAETVGRIGRPLLFDEKLRLLENQT
jgi:hypothetical protein